MDPHNNLRRACAQHPAFDSTVVQLDAAGLPVLDDPKTLAALRSLFAPHVLSTVEKTPQGWVISNGCFRYSGETLLEGELPKHLDGDVLHLGAGAAAFVLDTLRTRLRVLDRAVVVVLRP